MGEGRLKAELRTGKGGTPVPFLSVTLVVDSFRIDQGIRDMDRNSRIACPSARLMDYPWGKSCIRRHAPTVGPRIIISESVGRDRAESSADGPSLNDSFWSQGVTSGNTSA